MKRLVSDLQVSVAKDAAHGLSSVKARASHGGGEVGKPFLHHRDTIFPSIVLTPVQINFQKALSDCTIMR